MRGTIINRLRQISNTSYFVWLLLGLPLLVMTLRYIAGDIFYGEYIHATGEFSARLLIVTMAATPLRLLFPKSSWTAWLIRRRRYFGVAVFAYALPHLIAYLVKIGSMTGVIEEAIEPGMFTGWLALLLFIPLAITSNNTAVRTLGHWWKSMHRLVYLAAALTFVHWILVAFNPVAGFVHAGVLVLLEAIRIWISSRADHRHA